MLTDRLVGGDRAAVDAVRDAGHALGIALAALINLMDVPTIVLGGTSATLQAWLAAPLHTELTTRVISSQWAPPEIRCSALGGEAAVRGAAAASIQSLITNPDSVPTAPLLNTRAAPTADTEGVGTEGCPRPSTVR